MTTISDSTNDVTLPINSVFEATFLSQAIYRTPYFAGTQAGTIDKKEGTRTVTWRRIDEFTPTTTALTEQTTTAAYMGGRSAEAVSVTDVKATLDKYGQFVILNEEVDVYSPNATADEIFKALGISAGRSLNRLQRNIAEDNLTLIFTGAATSDGNVLSAVTATELKNAINTIDNNAAMTFTPMLNGSTNIGTSPLVDAYWGICHTHVAADIAAVTGFTPVEQYMGQTATMPGEFGAYTLAGAAVRFLRTSEASIDLGSGGLTGSTGLRGSTNLDLYTTVIYGQDALGSVGLSTPHPDGVFRSGMDVKSIEMIVKDRKSGGTSDPFEEIMTIAWKTFHKGAVLNGTWGRAIRSGATDLN